MDLAQYGDQAPGRLVKQGRGEAAYYAFVPNPLPPTLDFDLDLVAVLTRATAALGELSGLTRTLTNPYIFVRPFIRREAVASSRIEGTQADLGDLYVFEAEQRVLPGMDTREPVSEVREVYNYVAALDYGLHRLPDLPLSLRLIREIHARLMPQVRGARAAPGEFRRDQNWIGAPGSALNDALYVPPPVPQMAEALDKLERYLHGEDRYPALIRLAFVHYQFEAIHPFVDGNGRVGRLLLALLAVHWGLVPQPLLYLSPFFERNRPEYYDRLMGVSTRGAWRDWTELFLRAVVEQSEDAVHRVRRLQDLQSQWRARVTERRASARLPQLVDYLFEAPVLSIGQVRAALDVSYNSAHAYIRRLVGHGILGQVGEDAYGKLYIAQGIMDILLAERAPG